MAKEARAANSTHTADTSSPRESARTLQQTTPTRATAVQIAIDRGDVRRPGPPGRCTDVDVDTGPPGVRGAVRQASPLAASPRGTPRITPRRRPQTSGIAGPPVRIRCP